MTDYFDKPGLSFHKLKDFIKSPLFYFRKHVEKSIVEEDKDAYRKGRVFHLAILEPEKFAALPIAPPELLTAGGELTKKPAGKEFAAANRDWTTPEERAMMMMLRDRCMANPHVAPIIRNSKHEEEFATHHGDLLLKGKVDIICNDDHTVWDLKSIKNLDEVFGQARDFGYAEQVVWYSMLVEGSYPGGLILVEMQEPHRILRVTLGRDVITDCALRINNYLQRFKDASAEGAWPNDPPPITLTKEMLK